MGERFETCDVCGEKFWDEDINGYMIEVCNPDPSIEWVWTCLAHNNTKESK